MTRKMLKSKRDMLRNKRKRSSIVKVITLGLETKSGLRPNSSISVAYIYGQLPTSYHSG
jgi:hypothetical protein